MPKSMMTAFIAAASLASTVAFAKNTTPDQILGNQVGYSPAQTKVAVVPNVSAGEFKLIDKSNDKVVYTGKLSKPKAWAEAKETVKLADFSQLSYPGEYRLAVDGVKKPFDVSIDNSIYRLPLEASIKYLMQYI